MLINFSNEGLCTISCDKPNSDAYPVTNLISLNSQERKEGFKSEYFVKPPIQIEVNFICSINIDQILINCSNGAQKSAVVRIMVSSNSTEKIIAFEEVKNSKICFHRKLGRLPRDDDRFCYKRFDNPRYLNRVKSLKICILRSEASAVPVLGSLDIWGCVAKEDSGQHYDAIIERWKKIKSLNGAKVSFVEQSDEEIVTTISCSNNGNCDEFKVPEEFLDPITNQILTIPMTLPCGKVVDLSTIERYNKEESSNGRVPNDPFTGLAYTNDRKPLVASRLKERLDRFLLENSNKEELKEIPRTVGKKSIPLENPTPRHAPYAPSTSTPSGTTQLFKRFRDIDSLLESSLAGLPSFLEKPPVKIVKNDCMKCDSRSTLFKFTCGHIVCRQCLVSLKKSSVSECDCGSNIDFNMISRFHPDTGL